MKKLEVKRSQSRWSQGDRTLVLEEPACSVSCNSGDTGVGQTIGRWKGVSGPVVGQRREKSLSDRTLVGSGQA